MAGALVAPAISGALYEAVGFGALMSCFAVFYVLVVVPCVFMSGKYGGNEV